MTQLVDQLVADRGIVMSAPRLFARRASSVLAASLVAATGLAVATAGPAVAKSSITLHADARSVAAGQRVALTARGATDDFGGNPVRLCVDERAGHGSWRTVDCGAEGTLRVSVRAGSAGTLAFRAQLVARNTHGRFVVDRTSQAVTVHVR
ncbi:hypothetical protein DN069_00130 [Streptacidiphilus pinicola]|uniref:Uncharacterized protein n=1 Tax=Streptacidiphilus pinicola TaxID=2219663 RepID=A0A2X0KL71_9ACTN|nr:hypothetical protein [Streptacidiphilus pinicola]RAG87679.1 hypothetical protein DN069_00130 [Streptacidiphilus pinicola]